MIGYYLTIVLMVVLIAAIVFANARRLYGVCGGLAIFLAVLVSFFIGSSVVIGMEKTEAENFKEERDYCQGVLYEFSENTPYDIVDRTIQKSKSINERIENEKAHAYSKMWGFLYNKYIAELEPIDIPIIEYKVFKFNEEQQ